MFQTKRDAFTMIELVFVIVVIGILAAVAVPKLAATRDDATIVKARTTVAAVRSSVSSERQKRILAGDFANPVNALSTNPALIFERFNPSRDDIAAARPGNPVLEYPVAACTAAGARNCWQMNGANYQYVMYDGTLVDFQLTANGRFQCAFPGTWGCNELTR